MRLLFFFFFLNRAGENMCPWDYKEQNRHMDLDGRVSCDRMSPAGKQLLWINKLYRRSWNKTSLSLVTTFRTYNGKRGPYSYACCNRECLALNRDLDLGLRPNAKPVMTVSVQKHLKATVSPLLKNTCLMETSLQAVGQESRSSQINVRYHLHLCSRTWR